MVINDVKLRAGYCYYGYGRYGYVYGYGEKSEYFNDDVAPKSSWDKFLDRLDIGRLFGKRKKHK